MRQLGIEKLYVDNLDARKHLDFHLILRISPKFLIYFSIPLINCFTIPVFYDMVLECIDF